jgi:transcription elongation factor
MADDTEDAEAASARLEAALERIAALAGAPRPAPVAKAAETASADSGPDTPVYEDSGPDAPVDEIAARLDTLIDRLRAALEGRPG